MNLLRLQSPTNLTCASSSVSMRIARIEKPMLFGFGDLISEASAYQLIEDVRRVHFPISDDSLCRHHAKRHRDLGAMMYFTFDGQPIV